MAAIEAIVPPLDNGDLSSPALGNGEAAAAAIFSSLLKGGTAGTFGETKDGLGYIGPSAEIPRTLFALGFGGNGITFSVIAAQILRDMITAKKNTDVEIFRFNR